MWNDIGPGHSLRPQNPSASLTNPPSSQQGNALGPRFDDAVAEQISPYQSSQTPEATQWRSARDSVYRNPMSHQNSGNQGLDIHQQVDMSSTTNQGRNFSNNQSFVSALSSRQSAGGLSGPLTGTGAALDAGGTVRREQTQTSVEFQGHERDTIMKIRPDHDPELDADGYQRSPSQQHPQAQKTYRASHEGDRSSLRRGPTLPVVHQLGDETIECNIDANAANRIAGFENGERTSLKDEHIPSIPLKSRNRLSKRHSTSATVKATEVSHDSANKKTTKKRSSMFGSILGRSQTPRIEDQDKPHTKKLTKSDRRKTRERLSSIVETPVPISETKDFPGSSKGAIAHLPNLDEPHHDPVYAQHTSQTGKPEAAPSGKDHSDYLDSRQTIGSAEVPAQHDDIPVWPSSTPSNSHRAKHISYLQGQNIFPNRRPTQHRHAHHQRSFSEAPQHPPRHDTIVSPHRAPSDASSIYTTQQRSDPQNQTRSASSHMTEAFSADDRSQQPYNKASRPSHLYDEFSSGPYADEKSQPYDEIAREQEFREQIYKRKTMPPRQ